MPSVADLVEPARLQDLARPSDLRLGQEIARQRGIEFIEFGPLRVAAKVGGVAAAQTRRTVVLESTPAGLHWSCTCTRHTHHFCKHCVATALATWDEAPKRRQ